MSLFLTILWAMLMKLVFEDKGSNVSDLWIIWWLCLIILKKCLILKWTILKRILTDMRMKTKEKIKHVEVDIWEACWQRTEVVIQTLRKEHDWKEAINKKKTLLFGNMDLELRQILVKCYVAYWVCHVRLQNVHCWKRNGQDWNF